MRHPWRPLLIGLASVASVVLVCPSVQTAAGLPSALVFANSTDKVNHGATSVLSNQTLTQGTILAIGQLTATGGTYRIFQKGTAAENGVAFFFTVYDNTGLRLAFSEGRATASLNVESTSGTVVANRMLQMAAVWDFNGANGDQRLFFGYERQPLLEVSYAAQTVGSGSITSNASANAIVGNKNNDSNPWVGHLWVVQVWSRRLNQDEINRAATHYNPGGTVFSVRLGANGTGRVWDDSGQGNHGTITGATVKAAFLPRFTRGGPQ